MNNQTLFLIQDTLKKSGYTDYIPISKEILESKLDVEKVLRRIERNEPWEYIRGYSMFCNYKIYVNKNVLIPRVETEQMVEIARTLDVENVVDIGTGSGCIAIALADKFDVVATDISQKALRVAKKNSRKNNKNIKFVKTNLIQGIKIKPETLIIANLPYIPTPIYQHLDSSVKDYEPKLALDGGEDGNLLYKELFEQIDKLDIKPKYLLLETDSRIIKETQKLVQKILKVDSKVIKDYQNLDRFLLIHFS